MTDNKKQNPYKPTFDIFSMLDQMMKLHPHNDSQAMRNDNELPADAAYKDDLIK